MSLCGLNFDNQAQIFAKTLYSENLDSIDFDGRLNLSVVKGKELYIGRGDTDIYLNNNRYISNGEDTRDVFYFGVIGNGINDDTNSMLNAIAWLNSGSTGESKLKKLICCAGLIINVSQSLVLTKPCIIHFESFIYYTGATGSCIVVDTVEGTNRYNYDLFFVGLRSTYGNIWTPTGINLNGTCGIETRNCQFSRIVVNELHAFSFAGFFGNSNYRATNNHTQQSEIKIGYVGYCGYGVFFDSLNALNGAFQSNNIYIQDLVENYINLQIDRDTIPDGLSNNNIINISAIESQPVTQLGPSVRVNGSFNLINISFLASSLEIGPSASRNRIICTTPLQQILMPTPIILNNMASRGNELKMAMNNTLPLSFAPVDNNVYQNLYGHDIQLSFSCDLSNNGRCDVYLGHSANALTSFSTFILGANSATIPFSFIVKSGWFYKIDWNNNANVISVLITHC